MRSRVLSLVLGAIFVCAALFGVVGNGVASAQEYTLQVAGVYPSTGDTPRSISTQKLKEIIESKSDGKIRVNVYLDSQLGGDREILEATQVGNISIAAQTTAPQVSFIPELAVFDIPMLFENLDVARAVLSGPYRKTIEQWYEKAGLKLLMLEPISYRETTSNRPLNKLEDFKGLKIRTMENEFHIAFWKALGANPTPLNFAELYVALQQGIVDAQENPYDIIWSSKFYEVQKYLTKTHHIAFIMTMVMNKDQYDSMPAEYRKIVDESMKEASDILFNLAKEKESEMLASLKEKGMEVSEISPELRKQLVDAAAEVKKLVRNKLGDKAVAVDKLDEAIKNATN